MLTIELRVNGRLIGGAIVTNDSNLAELSNYRVESVEKASPETGHAKDFWVTFPIFDHPRKQTVWALVEQVARKSARCRRLGQYDQDPVERGT